MALTTSQTWCSGCYDCNSCNSCQKCNDRCQTDCNTIQTLCILNGQSYSDQVGNFLFSVRPIKNSTQMGPETGLFNKSVWDEAIAHINYCLSLGKIQNSGSPINYSTIAMVSPFHASEFNRVSEEVNGPTVFPNTRILGSYFTSLENAIDSTQINSSACDICNAKCDAGCDACLLCNTSNTDACGSVQTYTTCELCNQGEGTTCTTCIKGQSCDIISSETEIS